MARSTGLARVLLAVLTLRVLDSLWVRTYFDPDEFWQALEPAYCAVFGEFGFQMKRCHLTWEWQPSVRIRGFSHPLFFALLYKGLKIAGLDSRWAVAYGPRVLQGFFAWVADAATVFLSKRLFGDRAARFTLLCQVFNWFSFYASVRTYSNSLESTFSILALLFWPFEKNETEKRGRLLTTFSLIAVAVVIRPTAAALWIYPSLKLFLFGFEGNLSRVLFLATIIFPIAIFSFTFMVAVDSSWYGSFTMVPWNFVRVNLVDNVGAEYGIHAWHWYFSSCIPAIVNLWFVAFFKGARSVLHERRQAKILLEFITWSLLVLSLSGHKELRFALPILPVMNLICGLGLAEDWQSSWKSTYIVFAIICNILAAIYLSRFHQAAPLPLMDFLQGEQPRFIDFYTRCHATPFWSFMHHVSSLERMRFLDCSPKHPALANISSMNQAFKLGIEEEDAFFQEPLRNLESRLSPEKPSHLVFTTEFVNEAFLESVARNFGYRECQRFVHTPSIDFVVLCQ